MICFLDILKLFLIWFCVLLALHALDANKVDTSSQQDGATHTDNHGEKRVVVKQEHSISGDKLIPAAVNDAGWRDDNVQATQLHHHEAPVEENKAPVDYHKVAPVNHESLDVGRPEIINAEKSTVGGSTQTVNHEKPLMKHEQAPVNQQAPANQHSTTKSASLAANERDERLSGHFEKIHKSTIAQTAAQVVKDSLHNQDTSVKVEGVPKHGSDESGELKAEQIRHELDQVDNTEHPTLNVSGLPTEVVPQVETLHTDDIAATPTVGAPDGNMHKAPVQNSLAPEQVIQDEQIKSEIENKPTDELNQVADDKSPAKTIPPTEAPSVEPKAKGDPEVVDSSGTEVDEETGSTEPVVMIPAEDEMPSFDEWKARMLKDQEKVKSQEAQHVAQNGGDKAGASKKKNRVNCAAATCGAKILQSNAEATSVGYILTENRDQYMIQPCSAKKWFVVQLCEPVQVEVLELGNLELFSSLPQTFSLYVSDRYPGNWEHLATLKARDERTIQSFTISDAPFAKYIRIEILSHYGSQHYCPLSTLRLYGLSVHEDTDEESAELIEDVTLPPEQEPTNLFDSAKDTVISLVQGVLNGNGNSDNNDDTSLNKELELQVASVNGTANNTINATATTKPCTPDAITGPAVQNKSSTGTVPKPEVPSPNVDSKFTTPTKPSSGTLIRLIESPQLPLSVLLTRCKFCERTPKLDCCKMDRYSVCGYFSFVTFVYKTSCVDHVNAILKSDESLGFILINETLDSQNKTIEKINHNIVVSETLDSDKIVDSEKYLNQNQQVPLQNNQSANSTVLNDTKNSEQLKNDSSQKDQSQKKSDENNTAYLTNDVNKQASNGETDQSKTTVGNEEVLDLSDADTVELGTPSLDIPASVTSTDAIKTVPIAVTTESNTSVNIQPTKTTQTQATEPPMLGPDLVQIRPTDPEDVTKPSDETEGVQHEENADTTKPEKSPDVAVERDSAHARDELAGHVMDAKVELQADRETHTEAKTEQTANGIDQSNARIIQADETSQEVAEEYDHVTSGDEIQVQRLSISKETTYMKLKNKIKELEVNLNLSSTYLEELSQRYKKRMEEMYVSLDKTIQKLTNTSKTAEIQDQKQQERIGKLEIVVWELNRTVVFLSQRLELVHEEVIERHFYLLLIEFTIFLVVMAWCLNRQKDHYRERIRTVSENYFNATTPSTLNTPNPKLNQKGHRRGASMDLNTPTRHPSNHTLPLATTISSGEDGLRKTGSESDITIIEPNRRLFVCPTPDYKLEDMPKKKKKKKSANQNIPQLTNQHSPGKHFHQSKVTDNVNKYSTSHKAKIIAELPPRKSSTGTILPPNSALAPDLMYHSSANAFSVLTVDSPVTQNGGEKDAINLLKNESDLRNHRQNGVTVTTVNDGVTKGQGHLNKAQTNARRRLDVSGLEKSRSTGAQGASSISNIMFHKERDENTINSATKIQNGACETRKTFESSGTKRSLPNLSLSEIQNNGRSHTNDCEGYSSVFSEWLTFRKKKD